MSRSGWGLGSKLLYYVVHFPATTGCSCSYLVIVLMTFRSIHTVQYDIHYYLFNMLYVIWLVLVHIWSLGHLQ